MKKFFVYYIKGDKTMKKTRIFAILTVTVVMMTMLAGCAFKTPETFSVNGINITLTKDFETKEVEGYTVCFDSPKVSVFVVKEDFMMIPDMAGDTLEQYANKVRFQNDFASPGEVKTKDGITYYDYTFNDSASGVTYRYLSMFYKANDAFWIVQFGVNDAIYADFEAKIFEWAKSVTFE